jgi:N6-L-threonylcarbamoyladenine synthase
MDSQTALHQPYGGVIPELAARHHLSCIHGLIESCLATAEITLNDIDAVAATIGPGLIGSLLVGASVAKTLSLITEKPFLAVHHLYAHVASNYLESDLEPPFLCLLVSGGHTQLIHVKSYAEMEIVGETLDDAVGEAYDKVARVMGLGYPGGPILDKLAQYGGGNSKAISLPTPKTQHPWEFSFSGLKTAFVRKWEAETGELTSIPKQLQADFSASFQATAVNTLVKKTVACAEVLGLKTVSVAGGVSANSALRSAFLALQEDGYTVHIPKMGYCTDNAAMVGASAYFNPLAEGDLGMDVFSRVSQ